MLSAIEVWSYFILGKVLSRLDCCMVAEMILFMVSVLHSHDFLMFIGNKAFEEDDRSK
jgi:hypothetical protein